MAAVVFTCDPTGVVASHVVIASMSSAVVPSCPQNRRNAVARVDDLDLRRYADGARGPDLDDDGASHEHFGVARDAAHAVDKDAGFYAQPSIAPTRLAERAHHVRTGTRESRSTPARVTSTGSVSVAPP